MTASETTTKSRSGPFSKEEIKRVIQEFNTFDKEGVLQTAKELGRRMNRSPNNISTLVRQLHKEGARVNVIRKGEYYKTAIIDLRKTDPELFHKVKDTVLNKNKNK